MYFGWKWFEDRRPIAAHHDSRINVLVRPPSLAEVVRTEIGITRLQCLGYRHKESRRLGPVRLPIKIAESADHVYPVNRTAISMLVIAAIQDNLQLVPARRKIFVR